MDNDQNGFADCADNTCRDLFEQCQEKTDAACGDGLDNDKDGFFDCEDTSCKGRAPCLENTPTACSDGLDNDNDGFFDCKDFDCQGNPAIANCYIEPQPCTDDYEPNNSAGEATIMTVTAASGTVCQTFTICSSDKDYILVRYNKELGGYAASLFIKSLSTQVGSTIKAVPIDAEEAFSDEEAKQLKQKGTEAKVLNFSSFSCGSSSCTASLLLEVTATNAPTALSYSICVTLSP
ncbi:MAG: hypothetical protein MUF64_24270 [Polyangiaceae bacterium]|nr:hypothetical protein [Polyangiaceae bacterium]